MGKHKCSIEGCIIVLHLEINTIYTTQRAERQDRQNFFLEKINLTFHYAFSKHQWSLELECQAKISARF